VTNRDIIIKNRHILYVLDKNRINVELLDMTIKKINTNKRIRVTNKLINPQIFRHDQTVINDSMFNQQNIRQTRNESEKGRYKPTIIIAQNPSIKNNISNS